MIYHGRNGRAEPNQHNESSNDNSNDIAHTGVHVSRARKTQPVAIDRTFNNADAVKLNLRGFSNTKIAPEKIAILEYSRPMACYCLQ
jgi:hypothetical protein